MPGQAARGRRKRGPRRLRLQSRVSLQGGILTVVDRAAPGRDGGGPVRDSAFMRPRLLRHLRCTPLYKHGCFCSLVGFGFHSSVLVVTCVSFCVTRNDSQTLIWVWQGVSPTPLSQLVSISKWPPAWGSPWNIAGGKSAIVDVIPRSGSTEPVPMPTIPRRIASAFAVHCGHYGDVITMAKNRERSRQPLYREAKQVADAADGAVARPNGRSPAATRPEAGRGASPPSS